MENYKFKKAINIAMAMRDISNQELAAATGIDASAISALRSGWNNNPTLHTILRLADGIGVSATTLINYGEKDEEKLLRNHTS